MKKIISVLLILATALSFYIAYSNQRNEYTKKMQDIELNLKNSYKIMIPVNVDKNDREKSYKSIVKTLDKFNGSIYYDRISKDEQTRIKYIYDKNNKYISNIEIIDGKKLTSEFIESNKYLSTSASKDDLQIGRIATFNKNVNEEIKTLKSMLDDNFNFSGSCYVAFDDDIKIEQFINELDLALNIKGIFVMNDIPMNINQSDNYKIAIVIIYFIIMLLVLYELLNSYKKIGVKKLLGYSVKDIYIENILSLVKINLSIGIITTLIMSLIFFNQWNKYVYGFILKFAGYIGLQTFLLIGVCSVSYIYIFFIKIPSMLKNKKPLLAIIILNYIAKIVCLIATMFFITQAINNAESIKSIFNKSYSNWEVLNDFAVIPTAKIPLSVYLDENYYNNTYINIQKDLYKEFNNDGAILANFNEFAPGTREIRLAETKHYYESDNTYINPNYLKQYKIYDSENKEISISEDDEDQIILIPDKYKKDEESLLKQASIFKENKVFSTGENQKTRIIWIKSNQNIFTASIDINPESGNQLVDPIIYVVTEKNAVSSDYNCIFGIEGAPLKIKIKKDKSTDDYIREMFSKYGIEDYIGTITPVNEQVASSITTIKNNIKNSVIFMSLLIVILVIITIQNAVNYFDKYKHKLSVEKLVGYKVIDKHKNYFIATIISWNIVACASILIYKTSIIEITFISIICFIVEIIISIIILNSIERRKIIKIIKGE